MTCHTSLNQLRASARAAGDHAKAGNRVKTWDSARRACFSLNIVAADVRRRRFGQLSSGNPPPHLPSSDYGAASVGGYGVLKRVLRSVSECFPAMRKWGPVLALALGLFAPFTDALAEVNQVTNIAPDVYFHEGDLKGHGHCNNGWIVFADYVLVIDGNFPSGAQEIIPKIKATTPKPIRFVFDTHHHGDHSYGNQVWMQAGATPV